MSQCKYSNLKRNRKRKQKLFRIFVVLLHQTLINMSRKKKELPILQAVEITDVAAEGRSLARINDMVLFVPFVVPGDIVDVRVTRKKHHFMEGEAIHFHRYSDNRTEPFCQHFGLCGGCKWQCLPYSEQIRWKQRQVMDNLTRIGKIELPECSPILGSKQTSEYRNKLDFGCCNKQWLTRQQMQEGIPFAPAVGFHISGAFDKILPIENCHLMHPLHNEIRNAIRDYALEHNLSFFDLRQQTGLMRGIIIRCSNSGEWMVIVHLHYDHTSAETLAESQEQARQLLQYVADRFPQITSLLYLDNQKCNDTIGDQDIMVFKGTDHMFLLMENLKFKVGPKSFYQTNTEQAYILYSVARDFAGLTGNELVYDLYTGTGTIANFVAQKARKVIGIEYVPEAIEDAKVNSDINGIGNTLFYAGDMKDILDRDFIQRHGRPDVIITDPPRAGMHQDVIDTIMFAAPERIVYVSCNPATQARDLQLLDQMYQVVKIQPVDMFPHTQHVENVVLLQKRN